LIAVAVGRANLAFVCLAQSVHFVRGEQDTRMPLQDHHTRHRLELKSICTLF